MSGELPTVVGDIHLIDFPPMHCDNRPGLPAPFLARDGNSCIAVYGPPCYSSINARLNA